MVCIRWLFTKLDTLTVAFHKRKENRNEMRCYHNSNLRSVPLDDFLFFSFFFLEQEAKDPRSVFAGYLLSYNTLFARLGW